MIKYFVLPTMLGLYALGAGIIFHWEIAYVLAGISFGCVNAFLYLRWSYPTRWYHYFPYVLVFASGVEAILAHFHTRLSETSITFIAATAFFYVYLLLRARVQRAKALIRDGLENELYAALTKMKPGETVQMTLTSMQSSLLDDAFYWLQTKGWTIERYLARSFQEPNVVGYFCVVVAPPTEELMQASLERFHNRNDDD